MVECGENLGLALKPREALGIARKVRRQDLERDLALQAGVTRAVDLSHPPCAEGADDFIAPEAGARVETHVALRRSAPASPGLDGRAKNIQLPLTTKGLPPRKSWPRRATI